MHIEDYPTPTWLIYNKTDAVPAVMLSERALAEDWLALHAADKPGKVFVLLPVGAAVARAVQAPLRAVVEKLD